MWSRFRKAPCTRPCTGREAKFYRLTRKGRKQLETEAAGWERLTEAVGLILKLSEGGVQ
jgi:PadR family transcriptional regulator PadR